MNKIRELRGLSATARFLARRFVRSAIGKTASRSLRRFGVIHPRDTGPTQSFPSFSKAGPIPPTTEGQVRISLFSRSHEPMSGEHDARIPLSHCHTWVNGLHYARMEDNDIRGFVDGRYVAAWNQPTQVHVRLGRKPTPWARQTECELFRVLQRWSGLWLPTGAAVKAARLVLDVEQGVDRELEVLLYEVHKDWNPGGGGMLHNNNSAPALGEVWWNEVGRGTEAWGLPGAGFASDSHPRADTPITPLALARYHPGDGSLVFESNELAEYVQRRIAHGEPLIFLLKLADYLEDIPGTCIDVYSCNHGDDRNTARRPRLSMSWECATECARLERHIILEHGRTLTLPRLEVSDIEGWAVSFKSENEKEPPALSIRSGDSSSSTDWVSAEYPQVFDGTWIEVRLESYVNPVPFGQPFLAGFRDTWVTTGPPEDQEVRWTFTSPSGRQHTVLAEYEGDSRWRVNFVPPEPGRWHYQWAHDFTEKHYESAVGSFDVIIGDKNNALQAINWLVDQMNASAVPPGRERRGAFSVLFNRLQRGLIRFETPETYPLSDSHEDGGETLQRLDDARQAGAGTRPQRPRLAIDNPDGVTLG